MFRRVVRQEIDSALKDILDIFDGTVADRRLMDQLFNAKVLLHRIDDQQMDVIKKEAVEEQKPVVDQQDIKPRPMKDCEQLSVKQEADATDVTAVPKKEDEEEKLVSPHASAAADGEQ